MLDRKPSLTVLVPALNEEGALAETVMHVDSVLGGKLGLDFEILVVDDGSTDRTAEIADSLATGNPRVHAFHNGTNRGIGYSTRRGIQNATKEWFVVVPADDQFYPEDLERYIPLLESCDMVVGNMLTKKERTLIRRVLSASFHLSERVLFGLRFQYTGGMNVFRMSMLRELDLRADGHTNLSEIIFKMLRSGATYTTEGFRLRERQKGSAKAVRPASIAKAVLATFRLFAEVRLGLPLRRGRQPKDGSRGDSDDRHSLRNVVEDNRPRADD